MKKILAGFIIVLLALAIVGCKKTELTVTFNSNGGSAVTAVTVEKNATLLQPSSPTKAENIFSGWFTDEGLTQAYDFSRGVTENFTLYAKWTALEKDQFVVSFDSQGGSYVAPAVIKEGETVSRPSTPTKDKYKFDGWTLNGVPYVFTTKVTGNITLVATWSLRGVTNKAETYFTYISDTNNLNPYSETLANASDLYSLVSDSLYEGDYDWATAIAEGVASKVGDFTNTAGLPFTYNPSMANGLPEDVNGDGMVWRVKLKTDLQFVDGTPIDANTFNYSYQQLLDPLLLNARASNLFETDALPLVKGQAYFNQLSPDTDDMGFVMYTVGTVQYSRANSKYGAVIGHEDWPLYYPEQPYNKLVGPEHIEEDITLIAGQKAYLEDWGDGQFVLEDELGNPFYFGVEGELIAPYAGWTLDGVVVPHENEPAEYAEAKPAFMDAEKNYATVDEKGIPVDGVETFANAIEVPWDEVGFEVIDQYTMEFKLTSKKSQWQVMTQLSSAITSVVHPEKFETGKIEGGARTTYGTIDNPLVGFGVYELTEWVPGAFYIFTRNDDHHAAADYAIKYLRYDVISDQSVAVAEFIKGNLDVAGVSGEYFPVYENSKYLKLSPSSTFFRFAFSLDRGKDGDPTNDTPIMQDPNFRKALYLATDRETFVTDVNSPGYPTQGLLGPLYYSSEQNPFSYRGSPQGQAVLEAFSPDTFGFNPVEAKRLFDLAYDKAVLDGLYTANEVVKIEFVFFDAETNHKLANWLESSWGNIFGNKFKLVKSAVDSDTLDAAWDNGNFDLTFGGWQGMTFWAPGMLQVYSSVWGKAHMIEVGFDTGTAPLEVDLTRGKLAVQGWLDELKLIETPSATQKDYIERFELFLTKFEGNIYKGTYDNLGQVVYYVVLDYDNYDGRDVDFDNITSAMEGELLRQMINIPLFTRVGASIYSSRVVFDAQEFHARMGWGGLKYMSFAE